jgi:alanyl-tRNA synthetase
MKLEEIRSRFLGYFERHGHTVVASSALVPHNDPTLMFTNAGMVQFKNIFTGKEAAPNPPRAVSSQKCVRAGGKHNDLDNVGYTARHHTFFEMLGNFSFGDYFKEGAIRHAWTLLTQEFGLPAEKLYVTVYHTDDEAYALWQQIAGLPDHKILRIPTSDNFWAMGDTGPCGPCSEIFYDHGAEAAEGAWALNDDGNDQFGDRFIEIWNLVFMQFEQVDANTRIPLPKPCVDTGMGLERMAAVLQHQPNNYDIDLFAALIAATETAIGVKATAAKRASYRVIADHLRSCCFLIADGVMPSNEGRGYVLRRIMRRSMRHAHLLGAGEPLMHKLVSALTAQMGAAYPELHRASALITTTLKAEEERFRETLGRGLKLLAEEQESISKTGVLSGDVAFRLYDTYGFPLDLTQDILRGYGQRVDMDGFTSAMNAQKTRARAAWKGSGGQATSEIWLALKDTHGASEFLGYTQTRAEGIVLAIVKDGAEVREAQMGDTVQVLLNQTPLYAESGGQMGDTGAFAKDGNVIAKVLDCQAPVSGLHVHIIALNATLKLGDIVEAQVDIDRRDRIRANHSATHLLHASLRQTLGDHVTQKGSLVAPDKLRFDFSHTGGVTSEELTRIEQQVNANVWANAAVTTRLMTPDAAIAAGAIALFGEKYGEEVRVLTMGGGGLGERPPSEHIFSIELCGGTHVERTGDIGLFKILSESAIAAGIRRIEAVTRDDAYHAVVASETALKQTALQLTATPEDVPARVQALLDERKALHKELAEAKKQLALGGAGAATPEAETVNGVTFIRRHLDGLPAKELRNVALEFLGKLERTIVAVTTNDEGKGSVVVALSPDIVGMYDATALVKAAVAVLGGAGGGGRPDCAQGGGADGAKGEAALAAIRALL